MIEDILKQNAEVVLALRRIKAIYDTYNEDRGDQASGKLNVSA
ncbi:hypothetical protein C8J31_1694 [Rhizobium sp. PP-CC-2G-626]|nr:hypothetical protein C8J31_1694 [Rhizobium sp. PP-CC-2G-626]